MMGDVYKINPLVLLGVPTLQKGPISWAWNNSFSSLQFPLGAATARAIVEGQYVADARNQIAEQALNIGADYVLFLSDDVLPPSNIFNLLWRHRLPLTTGVYWTKGYPTQPYIWRDLMRGPFLDWKYGEFFKVDWAGCDALLVHTDVFRKIEPPWFSHDWVWNEGDGELPLATEDVYFYTKTREAGFDLWCDSAVQCLHQDRLSGLCYGLREDMPQHQAFVAGNDVPEDEQFVADLGCGHFTPHIENARIKRFDINPDVKPDVVCDLRGIPEHDETFDHIRASHVLEHFFFWEVETVLKEWARILKVGGTMEIRVPSMEFAAEQIVAGALDSNVDLDYAHGIIYGTRSDVRAGGLNDPQIHRTGFTRNALAKALKVTGVFDDIEVVAQGPDGMGPVELKATARKTRKLKPSALVPRWNDLAKKTAALAGKLLPEKASTNGGNHDPGHDHENPVSIENHGDG